jgi:hypothetical protein
MNALKVEITIILALIVLFDNVAISQARRLFRDDAKDTVFKIPEKHYDNLQPGSIAPDAVFVDFDYLEGIVNGAVLVHKGPLHALLDLHGNFVSPWGKYKFTFDRISNYSPLINVYGETGGERLINSKGNTILQAGRIEAIPWFRLLTVSYGTTESTRVVDMNGKVLPKILLKHTLGAGANLYYESDEADLIPYTNYIPPEKGKMPDKPALSGYLTKKGLVKIPPVYNRVNSFSEGLAAVENVDEFGVSKWGYINMDGKLIIPYSFQIMPGDFHNGLALVTPKNKTDFDFAYINQKGEVKIKIGSGQATTRPFHSADIMRYVNGEFINGYAFWSSFPSFILDTDGRFHPLTDLIKDDFLKSSSKVGFAGFDDLGIYINCTGYSKTALNSFGKGMIDYQGNLLFPPVFETLEPDRYSTHALATFKDTSYKVTKGIVNSQGIFILVQKPKSTF